MKIELRCLYWDNASYLIESHKKVTEHFELPVFYENIDGLRHGQWMDIVMENSDSDIIGFFDSDCVPLNRNVVDYAINYCLEHESFIGTAQVSNHIYPYSHVFAAPCFFFIHRNAWLKLGKPSFLENRRSDVAEELSYVAEEKGLAYKALYPTHFQKAGSEGVWKLGNYGHFGIGTVFTGGVYHMFQGRLQENMELFKEQCENIVNGTFTVENMFNAIDYKG